ncbi:unnamed protein product, partial [Didymodactylos carnosus]
YVERSSKHGFLQLVKNNTVAYHAQTNTTWKYIGTYQQIESTFNVIVELSVFRFMYAVIPLQLAYELDACALYRTQVLENVDVNRLKNTLEDNRIDRSKRADPLTIAAVVLIDNNVS